MAAVGSLQGADQSHVVLDQWPTNPPVEWIRSIADTGSKSDPVDTVAVAPAACSLRCAINKYLIAVYAVIGVVAAVAGVLLTACTGSGQPTSGSRSLELKAITAAARGGCVLKGGKGTVGGTLLAVALLGALENGLTVRGINAFCRTSPREPCR
ncbi:ABC transporter permease subunit [Streptomyces yanii]|uniref:ABC transporter permease subunit n=1 Tax=Streptomyces yanii TaxID=78510 RepID=UPI0031EC7E16